MINVIQDWDQLEKELTRELVECYEKLTIKDVNVDYIRGKIRGYKDILDMIGKEFSLIDKIGGGVK